MISRFFLLTLTVFFITMYSCGQPQGNALQQKEKDDKIVAISEYIKGTNLENFAVASFAGGCFWCTEAAFERIRGVQEVISGYAGGEISNPTYQQVSGGRTKHAETIQIFYDPEVISFETLLKIFFVAHDGTQVNRQGPDRGPQYRSEIFYHNEDQQKAANQYIEELNNSGKYNRPIATKVSPYSEFWVAEAYHQDYYPNHPENPYINSISKPKVEKVMKTFKSLLKEEYQ